MLAEPVDVGVGQQVGLVGELAGEGEGGPLGRGELRPVAVERGDLVFLQPGAAGAWTPGAPGNTGSCWSGETIQNNSVLNA